MSGGHLSKEFFELVKQIGESRSKQEEDKIITHEVIQLKQHFTQKKIPVRRMKEYLVRSIYVEMLGHDASFAYIHGVNLTMTNENSLVAKRIGYLACNVFLQKDHEFMLLLINTLQRDLNSTNHLEVCAALICICRLVNLEMVPAILPLVLKRLDHPKEIVRKKAIIALQRFYQLDASTIADARDQIRKVLCDSDPSVMGASLHLLHDIIKDNPAASKDLIPSFVSILKQITEHRLSRDYDYHRIPAPWLQVKLLQILGSLGHADQKASEQMYEIIGDCMRRADSGVNVGYAIVYECVKTIAKIYPNPPLIELAASNISRFISSENHNLRYLGVTGLVQIVQVNPSYAAEHQMVVVECLEDPDETLKRKTLNLLYRMTNPANCEVIADKLLYHLKISVDAHLRRELVQRITALAERYAPNNEWYVSVMNQVFELGGDLVPVATAHDVIRLLSEGTGENEAQDDELRRFAVNSYVKLLEKPRLPDLLVQLVSWVLGEYARLVTVDGYTIDDVVDLLCEVLERSFEDPNTTRGYVVSGLLKIVGQHNEFTSVVDSAILKYRKAQNTDLQQRCAEFCELQKTPSLMRLVLPYDAFCEDFDVDGKLFFLEGFVQNALASGMRPYLAASERKKLEANTCANGVAPKSEPIANLNFTPYEVPQSKPRQTNLTMDKPRECTSSVPPAGQLSETSTLNVSGPRKWGPSGYNMPKANTTIPQPPPQRTATNIPPVAPQAKQRSVAQSNTGSAAEPRQLTEKEKMAQALFSGVATSNRATAWTAESATRKAESAAATPAPCKEPVIPATAPPPQVATPLPISESVDLLDFDSPTSSVTKLPAAQAPAPAPLNTGLDILSLDIGGPPLNADPAVNASVAPVSPLIPLVISTQEIGTQWASLPVELTSHFPNTKFVTCRQMVDRLQSILRVREVEIIGTEAITAGKIMQTRGRCFLHGKLDATGDVSMLLRCDDPGTAHHVMEILTRHLAG
eukprot:GEMP01004985.1.p1 GENE.GEMP01004985.1~~GEMP01004985.1.p1  ORF type:complete len:979 (+),score=207.70 GEMP01004985.1:87-3023(+)